MDATENLIRRDPAPGWLAALRLGLGVFALVVGWFILSMTFGGTAAYAASEAEPDATGTSLLGTLADTAMTVTDPHSADPERTDLQSVGGDVTESLDAVVSELPIVPELVGETPVHNVTAPVLHTADRVLEFVSETAESVLTRPVSTTSSGDVPRHAEPTDAAADTEADYPAPSVAPALASLRANADLDQIRSPLLLTPLAPLPLTDTTSTGVTASVTGAPATATISGAGWSPLAERAENPPADSNRCPASATYDSDSTPD